jgi:aspartate/methionine/tyrosine aminotransferase
MQISPFRIEHYFALHEFTAQYLLSSSDAESRPVKDLLAFEADAQERLLELWCGYTEGNGAKELREAIATLYERISPDDVLAVSAAEEGIFLLYHALLSAGDHAIIETPCYESGLELARSTGAEVSLWRRRWEEGWQHDLDALKKLLRPNTRLLYINTPSNPLGLSMPRNVFDAVMDLARDRGLIVFCDEVYRELERDPGAQRPAVCDAYEHGVSLGSISKAYGLPGLRLGWLATRDPQVREKCLALRYYTTICNSAPSEFLVALALRHRGTLIEQNLGILRRNLPLLEAFLARRSGLFSWVRPDSGIGFPRLADGVDVDQLCAELVRDSSVMLLPGGIFDHPQHVRISLCRRNMPEALDRLDAFLERWDGPAPEGR